MNLLTVSNGKPKGMEEPPDSEIIIRLEGVSVRYRLPRERIASFKEYAILTLQRQNQLR